MRKGKGSWHVGTQPTTRQVFSGGLFLQARSCQTWRLLFLKEEQPPPAEVSQMLCEHVVSSSVSIPTQLLCSCLQAGENFTGAMSFSCLCKVPESVIHTQRADNRPTNEEVRALVLGSHRPESASGWFLRSSYGCCGAHVTCVHNISWHSGTGSYCELFSFNSPDN